MKLQDKISIVTGSGRGIGRAICLALAREGSHIVAGDIDIGLAEKVSEEVRSLNRQALPVKCDVSNKKQVNYMVEAAIKEFGKVDILVNNAGVITVSKTEDLSEQEWDRVLNVNLKGVFLCSQAVIKLMQKQKSGKIINIASSAGKIGGVIAGINYSTSKAGVIGFTIHLAKELAPYGINVNAVAPGFVDTALIEGFSREKIINATPLRRLGEPEDIARAVVFLASEDSDFVTGEILDVNGGIVMD